MVYLTDTATTTDSRDVYFPLNLVCVRERERGTRTTMERSGLSPSLPLLWQESASGKLRVSYNGDASGGEAGGLGGVVSCGAGVRLVSKASYGTSTLKHYSD